MVTVWYNTCIWFLEEKSKITNAFTGWVGMEYCRMLSDGTFCMGTLCGDYTVLLRKLFFSSFVGTQATSVLKYYSPLCKNENRQ